MVAETETPREAIARLASVEICRRSFLEFLKHVKIRSDDPKDPGIAPWQPWPDLVTQAEEWEKGQSQVILKARQLGYTWLLAAYLAWRARNGAATAVFSVGQREAREVLRRVRFIETYLPDYLKVTVSGTVDDVQYPQSTGSIYAFPSTEQAGISFTFQLAAMDEGASHPFGAPNYAALRPTLSAGGQFILLSTADPELGPAGFFYEMWMASDRQETPYDAVFVPWSARPSRDQEWYENEKAAFAGDEQRFNAYYPNTPAEAFIGRSGLVYPMFSMQRHVPSQHPWKWADSKRRVAGVDFGGGDPTAIVMLGLSGTHKIHQFGEFYQKGAVSIEDIAGYIGQWGSGGWVMCDPSEPVAIASLRAALKPNWNVVPADNRRGEGLQFTGWLLENDRLTIHESCVSSINEFSGYRWRERTDPNSKEKYQTSTPVDHHADAMDARRYALMELMHVIRPSRAMPRNLAKVAV